MTILPFNDAAQTQYEWLQSQKIPIGTLDKRIAAIVLSQNGTLITRNQRDFARIPGLRFTDWSR